MPLGGLRAMPVRRTLPSRQRTLIGAWCFIDHYGPDDVAATVGMNVARHPHTGLATASWLFTGEIEHRDSAGNHAMVRPGELWLMTAGRGITHSEFSTPETTILHGAQLWLALPDAHRHVEHRLDHYVPEPVIGEGWQLRVFLGSLAGSTSTVPTYTPLLGAEIVMQPGTRVELSIDPSFEHGILLDKGSLRLDGVDVPDGYLAYLEPGANSLVLEVPAESYGTTRALILGGTPFGEQIIMWWNFIGRTHDEIVEYRRTYQATIGLEHSDDAPPYDPTRFGPWPDGEPAPIPAPMMPNVRLRLRS